MKMKIFIVLSAPGHTAISPLNPEVREILMEKGLPIPVDNLEFETGYREVLGEHVKSAWEMYGFIYPQLERRLHELSARGHEVKVFFISSRYGLIEGNLPVVPHIAPSGWGKRKVSRGLADKLMVFEELLSKVHREKPDIVVLALSPGDLPLLHDPPRGRDLGKLTSFTKMALAAPPSVVKELVSVKGLEFVEVKGSKLSLIHI